MSEENNNNIMLPAGDKLVLSVSPHISTPDSTRKIMCRVLLALVPALIAAIWFFGWDAVRVIVLTLAFCVGAEALWCRIFGKPVRKNILDGSAAVTGLLLAFNLPSSAPWWVCLIGALLAIWLGKQVFGGLGRNPFNPALVARVALLIAFPAIMTTWPAPRGYEGTTVKTADYVTCATPLSEVGTTPKSLERDSIVMGKFEGSEFRKDLFLGKRGGCLGETSVLALLIGGVMLLAFRLINWRIPFFYIGTVALITCAVNYFYPGLTPTALFHVLTGGLMLGAFFMATDMVTSPVTNKGSILFAIGCGVITSLIRIWGNYPEGVSFSILFMNALVPLIDRWTMPKVFGSEVAK